MIRTVLGTLLGVLLMLGAAQAAVFKIATIAPDGTSWMEEFRKGAEEIKRRSDGRVEFRFYPGGVMGNDKSVLRKIRVGQLQGGALTGGGLAEISSDSQIYGLPFSFRSLDEVDYVRARMDGLILQQLEKEGFISFGLSEGGFAYMMSNQPIRAIEDLKHQKVWVPEGDRISRAAFESVNIFPISLPLTDVLTGLQTGLVDSVGASPIGAIALQWHTRVKYMTDMPLLYLYGTLVVSRAAFEKLAAADQTVVREVFGDVLRRLNAQNRIDNEKARDVLKRQGIEFIVPEQQGAGWQTMVEQTVERLTDEKVFSAEILHTLQSHLDDYRRGKSAGK